MTAIKSTKTSTEQLQKLAKRDTMTNLLLAAAKYSHKTQLEQKSRKTHNGQWACSTPSPINLFLYQTHAHVFVKPVFCCFFSNKEKIK